MIPWIQRLSTLECIYIYSGMYLNRKGARIFPICVYYGVYLSIYLSIYLYLICSMLERAGRYTLYRSFGDENTLFEEWSPFCLHRIPYYIHRARGISAAKKCHITENHAIISKTAPSPPYVKTMYPNFNSGKLFFSPLLREREEQTAWFEDRRVE